MASAMMAQSDSKLIRKPRPLMLKDFLRDDMSSCSSNGFKSFPRRQPCCTTVRYLVERDLKAKDRRCTKRNPKRVLKKSRSKAASTTISAFQVVINAVKHLPFASTTNAPPLASVQNRNRKGLLPRSFSRKMLSRSFWRKSEVKNEKMAIQKWKSFRDFLEEKPNPSESTSSTNTIITTAAYSTSTTSNSNSNSWSDISEFTSEYLHCSSGDSECSGENDAVESKKQSPQKKVSKRVSVKVGDDSMESPPAPAAATTATIEPNTTKEWSNEEEKEQLSPVSVLDCPFDNEEDNCSPFQRSFNDMEGSNEKFMQKIRRLKNLVQLEPVNLQRRIALSDVGDNEATLEETEEMKTEEKATGLLDLVKAKIPSSDSNKFKSAENLLLDFFTDSFAGISKTRCGEEYERGLLKVAEDWINGQPRELMILDWKVQGNRNAYVRDMEEGDRWRKFDEENEEVGLEVEVEVWDCLVNELVLDLFS